MRDLKHVALTFLTLGISVMLFTACSFRPKAVTISSYVIDSGEEIDRHIKPQPQPISATLIIAPMIGALPFRTQKILYRKTEISLSPYLYSRWEYSPTHMLTTKVFWAIDRSRLFKAVSYRSTGIRGDLYLETTLFDFSQHIGASGKTSTGVLSIMVQLIDAKSRKMIGTKTFTIRKPAPSLDARGAVTALNEDTNVFCIQLIQWLKKTARSDRLRP
jgi:cholesterol transport system auxiliary component